MSARQSTPRQRDSLKTILWVLWLSELGLVFRAISGDFNLVRYLGRALIDFAAILLIIAGVRAYRSRVRLATGRSWVISVIVVSLWCAVYPFIRGDVNLVGWVTIGIIPYISLVGVFALAGGKDIDRLIKHLTWQLLIAVVLGIGVLIFAPPMDRVEWNGINGDGPAKLAARAMFGLPFLLAYLHKYRLWQMLLVSIALVLWLLLGITGASRGMLVLGTFVFPALIIISAIKQKRNHRIAKYFMNLLGVGSVAVIGIAVLGHGGSKDYFLDRLTESVGRLTRTPFEDSSVKVLTRGAYETTTDEFLGEGGRAGELNDFFSQFDPIDYLVGRGFGTSWHSQFWGLEWPIVHFGPAHLLFLGGIPLLFTLGGVFNKALVRSWKLMPSSPAAAGAFCYLASYLVGFLQHGVPGDDPTIYLLWICVGLAFAVPSASYVPQPGRS